MWYENKLDSVGIEGVFENDDPGFQPLPRADRNSRPLTGLAGLGFLAKQRSATAVQKDIAAVKKQIANKTEQMLKAKNQKQAANLQKQLISLQQRLSELERELAALMNAPGGGTTGGGTTGGGTNTGGGKKNLKQECIDAGKYWNKNACYATPQTNAQKKAKCIADGRVWKKNQCQVAPDPNPGGGGSTQGNPCQVVLDNGDVVEGTIDSGGNCKQNTGGPGGGGGGPPGGGGTFGDDTQAYTIQTYDPQKCVQAKQKFNQALANGRKGPRQWDQFARKRAGLMTKVNSLCPPAPPDPGGGNNGGGNANQPCTIVINGVQKTGVISASGDCVVSGGGNYYGGGGNYGGGYGGGGYQPQPQPYYPPGGYGDPYVPQDYVPTDPFATGMEVYESDLGGGSMLQPIAPAAAPGGAVDASSLDDIPTADEFFGGEGGEFGEAGRVTVGEGQSPEINQKILERLDLIAAALQGKGGKVPAELSVAAPASDKGDMFANIPQYGQIDLSDAEGYGPSYGESFGERGLTQTELDEAYGLKPVQGRVLETVS